MNKQSLNNKGFSLVEILVALAISSIVLLGVALFVNAGSRSYKTTSTQATLQNETQDVLNYLNNLTLASSDAGWSDNVLYVLQPDSINTSQGNATPNYYVHCIKHVDNTNCLYYMKTKINDPEFTTDRLNNLKTDVDNHIVDDKNMISNQVSYFDARIERLCKSGDVLKDQSLYRVVYSLDVFVQGEYKTSKISVKPRNLITPKFFNKVSFALTSTKFGDIAESGKIAGPGGEYNLTGEMITDP